MKIGEISYDLREPNNVFIWQYSRAANLNRVLEAEIDFYQKAVGDFYTDWEKDVFNLKTANSFGLSVWAKILGVSRPYISPQNYAIDNSTTLRLYNPNDETWHSIWLSGALPALNIEVRSESQNTQIPNFPLDDETFRKCLLAKLQLLYSNGSVYDINSYLANIFTGKSVYVQDNYDMTMNIVFSDTPTDADLTIITSPDFSPKVAGVFLNTGIDILSKNTFGFEENNLSTWINRAESDPKKVEQGYGNFYNLLI